MIKGRTSDGKVGVTVNEDKNSVVFNRKVIPAPADDSKKKADEKPKNEQKTQ